MCPSHPSIRPKWLKQLTYQILMLRRISPERLSRYLPQFSLPHPTAAPCSVFSDAYRRKVDGRAIGFKIFHLPINCKMLS
jgi:hypothetical protein